MSEVKALTGNKCAAIGAALCRPDLIAAYPITPQSSVVESLADMVYSGALDSRMVQVESEHSAMSVVQGAAAAGGRVFTATSAQGLALMFEPYFRMSTLRLPMVMAIATREMTSPETIWSGQQDAMSVREAGWIQCFCETNQEILDMMLQGYMLAEDPRVLIPVNVCYDGFYSSHLVERVEIPSQAEADAFLPPYSLPAKLDPRTPQALDPMTPGELLMKYRRDHLESMKAALAVIDEVDAKFAAAFGRSYGGCIDTYRMEGADFALVTVGGMTGAARDVIDELREAGLKLGAVKLRFTRPFPAERVKEALAGVKGFAAVDRSVSFGWGRGADVRRDLRRARGRARGQEPFLRHRRPRRRGHIHGAPARRGAQARGAHRPGQGGYALAHGLRGGNIMSYIDTIKKLPQVMTPGSSACQGCGGELITRRVMQLAGNNSVFAVPPGCMAGAGVDGWSYQNGCTAPIHITLLDNTASFMSGVSEMYQRRGRTDVNIVAIAGDGATADCGFQSLSGAAERGAKMLYVCYDNEGYMNTGFQRSSTTSLGSRTSTTPAGSAINGKEQGAKYLPLIMAMHNIEYCATASPSHMMDLTAKIKRGLECSKRGFAYLHVFSPCPTGWGFRPDESIAVARRAVESNAFPLWECERGKYYLSFTNPNPMPIADFVRGIGKFSRLGEEELQALQSAADTRWSLINSLAASRG